MRAFVFLLLLPLSGCVLVADFREFGAASDAGELDAAMDAALDGGPDTGVDASPAIDASPDTGVDAGVDANVDAGPAIDDCEQVFGVACADFVEGYFKASNTGPEEWFGMRIAIDGDVLAVGAVYEQSAGEPFDDSVPRAGAVYVYERDVEGSWSFSAYLKAEEIGEGDLFGVGLSVSGDHIAVGAHHADRGGREDVGEVTLFRRNRFTGAWEQQQRLVPPDPQGGDAFGLNVEIVDSTLVVGAYGSSRGGTGVDPASASPLTESGTVYVYDRAGEAWELTATIKASNAEAGDHFGRALAFDGSRLVVGAYDEDGGSRGVGGDPNSNAIDGSGAAYVFEREGTRWREVAYLKATNTGGGDWFGYEVAVDGDTIIVGSYWEDGGGRGVNSGLGNDDSVESSGAAYVYRFTGGLWRDIAYLKPPNTHTGQWFGSYVDVAGSLIAIGAYGDDASGRGMGSDPQMLLSDAAGAVFLYRLTSDSVEYAGMLKSPNAEPFDQFGTSVALSDEFLAVGAAFEDSAAIGIDGDASDNSSSNSGSAYLFRTTPRE